MTPVRFRRSGSRGGWDDAVGVAGLVDALVFLVEVELPVGVEVVVAGSVALVTYTRLAPDEHAAPPRETDFGGPGEGAWRNGGGAPSPVAGDEEMVQAGDVVI